MELAMKRILWVSLVILLLASPSPAYADIAPPMNPPGANPGPESETTQVRMMAETVLIEVLRNTPAGSLARALVTADFTMRNMGTESESMAARFPISSNDGSGNYPEIRDLQVKVDGRTVGTRRTEGVDPNYGNATAPWAEFNVAFPPGEDVQVRVVYTLDGSGELAYTSFYYLLETGAGWKDTIGSADLIVRLPYEASPYNIILGYGTGWSTTTSGGVISGREIRWHYEDLEPGREHNLEVSLVRPSYWVSVLTERENLTANPNDGEAWGRLGRDYKDIIVMRKGLREDAGGLELYGLSVEAYERALGILPEDALWHAGFADLLATHAYWTGWGTSDTRPEALRAMQEIQTALDLSPRDAKVREFAEQIYYTFPDAIEPADDGYTFLWLTATPTAPASTETPEAAPTPIATAVPPTPSPVPLVSSTTPEAERGAGTGLPCGSAAMAMFPLTLLMVSRGRRARASKPQEP
jgi:hypothetical protein